MEDEEINSKNLVRLLEHRDFLIKEKNNIEHSLKIGLNNVPKETINRVSQDLHKKYESILDEFYNLFPYVQFGREYSSKMEKS